MASISDVRTKLGSGRTVLIVRGAPGSGKSHLLKELAKEATVHQTAFDDFRYRHGKYVYDPKDNQAVASKAMAAFRAKLDKAGAGEVVSIEGVFSGVDKMEDYRKAARMKGAKVVVVTVDADHEVAAKRGVHGVDVDKVRHMREAVKSARLPEDWEHVMVTDGPPPPPKMTAAERARLVFEAGRKAFEDADVIRPG